MPDIFSAPKKEKTNPPVGGPAKKTVLLKQKQTHALAAFMPRPEKIRFDTQQDKEQILLLVRRHPITNIPWIVLALIIVAAPFFLTDFVPLGSLPANFQFMLVITWYLLTFAFVFEKFLTWFFNVGIVTDERVVDIDFPNILYKDIGQAKLHQIQDIDIKVGGFIRSLFDYGDVYVQTAGEVPEIEFEAVPHPSVVAQIINELTEKTEHEGGVL